MARKPNRFHGRVAREDGRACDRAGCEAAGEFRAPKSAAPQRDGYYWFCLDHVRAYNAAWNVFDHLSPEEARRLAHGQGAWNRPTQAFGLGGLHAGAAALDDPHGIFRGQPGFSRFAEGRAASHGGPLSPRARQALDKLGLDERATLADIRRAYKALLKRFHPDMNGGDRGMEGRLAQVIAAYQCLTGTAPAPAGGKASDRKEGTRTA
ncbi:MAG: DnaJ domain-containing protein [Pseudomonadota bacterium]